MAPKNALPSLGATAGDKTGRSCPEAVAIAMRSSEYANSTVERDARIGRITAGN